MQVINFGFFALFYAVFNTSNSKCKLGGHLQKLKKTFQYIAAAKNEYTSKYNFFCLLCFLPNLNIFAIMTSKSLHHLVQPLELHNLWDLCVLIKKKICVANVILFKFEPNFKGNLHITSRSFGDLIMRFCTWQRQICTFMKLRTYRNDHLQRCTCIAYIIVQDIRLKYISYISLVYL